MTTEPGRNAPLKDSKVAARDSGKALSAVGEKTFSGEGFKNLLSLLRIKLDSLETGVRSPLRTSLPPLKSILNILAGWTPESGEREDHILLAGKILSAWLDKYGEDLPLSSRKDLNELLNVMKNAFSPESEGEQELLYSFRSPAAPDRTLWKASVYRDGENGRDEEGGVSCLLEMETENLGAVQVRLKKGNDIDECLFFCKEDKTRRILRSRIKEFARTLNERGRTVPRLEVMKGPESAKMSLKKRSRGVDLWG